jgi:hypothetical protein
MSFAHHISKSIYPGSHRRRIPLADTTHPVSTPQERQLWEQLYCLHTRDTKTRWQAFLLDWNKAAEQGTESGLITPKTIN